MTARAMPTLLTVLPPALNRTPQVTPLTLPAKPLVSRLVDLLCFMSTLSVRLLFVLFCFIILTTVFLSHMPNHY